MTKTKIRHHKRTDDPLLIPRSTAMYHGECDVDENGYPITYEVELWEYPDFLKREAKFSRHTFTAKTKAQKFVQERMEQRLVAEVTVWRLRHTWQPYKPVEYKKIYEYEV